MKGKLIISLIVAFSIAFLSYGQPAESNVLDGAFKRATTVEKEILPYDHLREADAFWEKRVWRVIDVREKMNLPFAYPKEPFIDILLEAAENGEATLYDPIDDEFTEVITVEELQNKLGGVDTVPIIDPDTYEETFEIVNNDFDPASVTKFRLKEVWVFDEERAMLVVRILGIAPIEDVYDDNGNYRGQRPMFWVYYPELRTALSAREAFNPFNDAIRMSWEDILEMRMFSSYIYKESNVYDRRIQDYATGVDALYESDRIKNEIMLKEHDLWTY